jgi:nitrous oxidase accessory protein
MVQGNAGERLGRIGLVLSALLLIASSALPYWQVRVIAPQYPQGLRLTVFVHRLDGDVRELDILNHYIGMKPLAQAAQRERAMAMPAIALSAALLLLAAFAPYRFMWLLILPAVVFPITFVLDLHWWLHRYGTHLDPKAPMRIPPFVPPLIGTGKIAQFQAIATFHGGFVMATVAALLAVASVITRWRYSLRRQRNEVQLLVVSLVVSLVAATAQETFAVPSSIRIITPTFAHPTTVATFTDALKRAPNGATVVVSGGVHRGNFVVTKSLTLIGENSPVLDGGGNGTVITLKAPRTTLKGFVIRNSGSTLSTEDAGIAVEASRCVVENNRLDDVLFGIVLRNAPQTVVRHNELHGKPLPLPRRGDLIKVWYSDGVCLERNKVVGGRDAVLWFSRTLTVRHNTVTQGRYGIHFMYCDDALVEGNRLRDNAVGIYLMYSRNLRLRRNLLVHNRGPSGYGIGLKDMYRALIADNLIAANRVGIFAEGATLSHFERNFIAHNDIGILLFPSSSTNTLTANSFVDNGEQVAIEGVLSPQANRWRGNFWSDYGGYDADGDGIGDVPYKAFRWFERLTERQSATRFFAFSLAAHAVDFAARCFPVFAPQPQLVDNAPRMAPLLPRVGVRRPSVSLAWVAAGIAMILCATLLHLPRFSPHKALATIATTQPDARIDAIVAAHLTKHFGGVVALNDVSFAVASGETLALWGPNGAGKTTLLRCLLGVLAFDGAVRVMGHDPRLDGKAVRRLVGYLPQDIRLPNDWTVAETLHFFARLRRAPAEHIAAAMDEWRLNDIADKPVSSLSGGMRQRLAFALALLSDPPILLLDEPTANLDARTRSEVWAFVERLKRQGKTIVLCSHRADEVRRLADRVLVLDNGNLVAVGTPQELADALQTRVTLKLFVAEPHRAAAAAVLRQHGFAPSLNGSALCVPVPCDRKVEPLCLLAQAGIAVTDFELGEGSGVA